MQCWSRVNNLSVPMRKRVSYIIKQNLFLFVNHVYCIFMEPSSPMNGHTLFAKCPHLRKFLHLWSQVSANYVLQLCHLCLILTFCFHFKTIQLSICKIHFSETVLQCSWQREPRSDEFNGVWSIIVYQNSMDTGRNDGTGNTQQVDGMQIQKVHMYLVDVLCGTCP